MTAKENPTTSREMCPGILGEPSLGMDPLFHAHLLPIQSIHKELWAKTHGQKDHQSP